MKTINKLKTNLLFIFLMLALVGNAQLEEGKFNISLSRKVPVNKTKLMRSNLVGLDAEYMVTDNVGLNYAMSGGEGVFHMPGGIVVGAALLCVAATAGGNAEMLLYSFAIPEGVTYNVKVLPYTYVSPYVNPLGLEVHRETEERWDYFLMGSAGAKLKMFIPVNDNFDVVFSTFYEAQLEYRSDQKLGVRAGLSCGISF